MNRSKKICVLLALLIAVSLAAFGVSRYEQHKEEIKNSDEVILELKNEDVKSLSWEYEETKLAFHKDETWMYDDDETFPVSKDKVEQLLGVFESFGVSFIIKNVEDYAQYGLDDPACSIRIETDDKTYEILLGDYSVMDEERYVSIGDGNVYLTSSDPMEFFQLELKDMIENDKIPSIDKAEEIVFAGSESYKIVYQEESAHTYNEEDVYFVKEDQSYLPLDTSAVELYLSSVSSLSVSNYVSYHAEEEELARYGLDTPELQITVQYPVLKEEGDEEEIKSFVLNLSRSAEEKAKEKDGEEGQDSAPAYFRVGESRIIYEITGAEYESLLAASYNDLRHQQVIWADFADVYQVDISLDGQDYTLSTKEEKDETIWYYQDKEIDIADFQSALSMLTASEFTDKMDTEKEEISLTVYLGGEKDTEVQISLYRQDGSNCAAAVDGTPVSLVNRSYAVDLVEAVHAIVLN